MLKIIIPLASDHFIDESGQFNYPLPLIEINGKSVIEYVLSDLDKISGEKQLIFILKEQDCTKYNLDNSLKLLVENPVIVPLKAKTKGAVCSILMAIDYINHDDEILIVNSDQIIECDYNDVLANFRKHKADGGIISFNSVHPRWSYAKVIDKEVFQTAEKNPISNEAIAGFYYFHTATDFIEGAFDVIRYDENYEGRYYTSSVFNQMILKGKKIISFPIAPDQMHSFYSVQKLKEFEKYLLG
jgi:NDP-sugar pyrophosphorylase family protein